MAYFEQDFLDFLSELADNNSKQWMDKNRKRYEKTIRDPFKEFVAEMIFRIQEFEPDLGILAKDSIFRINRDIRFTKDKTPYKTYMAANIKRGGRTAPESSGFYFTFATDKVMIAGGVYHADKDGIYNIRNSIANNLEGFNKIINKAKFKKKFGPIAGEKHKRIPHEFQAAAEKQPLIANKQFHYHGREDSEIIVKNDLPDQLMEYYLAAKDVHFFLKDALDGK